MKQVILFINILLVIASCSHTSREQYSFPNDNIFKYAKNIYSREGSDTVVVYFTWGADRDSVIYILGQGKPNNKTQYISVPVKKIATLSTTDMAMVAELGRIDAIAGVCDPYRISNDSIRSRYNSGLIAHVGTSMDVNREALLALSPDLVITSAFSRSDFQKFSKIQSVTMPIVYTMSWQENTPLARVEWIKFIGMLLGESSMADSLFRVIEHRYDSVKAIAQTVSEKPLVLAGAGSNDIWYMPGGKSYIASFVSDAGGDYIWKDDESTGSVVLNFEQVLQVSQNADVWIGCDAKTYKELAATHKNYTLLSVFKKQAVYNRTKRSNLDGGNDYWEYGYVRPDIVLADYLSAIHPELLPGYETVFLEKLTD